MHKPQKVKKAVITVAGLGTRFLPASKAIPKELIPVLDKPVIQYLVEEMADSGIEEVILVNSPEKKAINKYFQRDLKLEKFLTDKGKYERLAELVELIKKIKISFVYQRQAKGNGHALLMARKAVGREPFAVADGDSIIDAQVPATRQVIEVFNQVRASVIGAQKIRNKKEMTKYGNIYGEKISGLHLPIPNSQNRVYKVKKIVEKPPIDKVSPHGLIVGGMRYVFTPDIWPALERQKPSRANEIWLADAANALARQSPFYAYVYQGKYFDTGRPEGLLKTSLYFSQKL